MPLPSSPLHRKEFQTSPVAPTPTVLTVPDLGGPLVNIDTLETISTYTADGEGEDEVEIEEVTIVHDMLVRSSILRASLELIIHPL